MAILLPAVTGGLIPSDVSERFVMSLISGNALSQAATELSRHKVKLCHACQLSDLRSYLELGGVPSRNLLTTRGLPYTIFDTDDRDRENAVWRLVFFNLSDFGHWFARRKNTIPNPFGPVLLCFDPAVICQAADLSITLRSAGAGGFDRIAEGIDIGDIPRLFIDAESPHVRFGDSLRAEFGRSEAQSPEMSLSFPRELAPLSYLIYIIVDPYVFPNGWLTEIGRQIIEAQGASFRVFKRWCANGCETRYQVLLDAILSGVRAAPELRDAIPDASPMADWRDAILRSRDLSFQFGRYARYFFEGTVSQRL
jgi:hypothetical protein